MFSLRHLAYATVFLMLFAKSGFAQPDFNAAEIDIDLQLASLPLPPDIGPIKTSDFLEVELSSGALRDRPAYLPVIVEEAAAHGVPPALVDAVVRIESRYDPTVVGSVGEVGLMQVRPKTAALLGFQGTSAELAEPKTNLRYGVGYLAKAWRLAGGDLCRALMKYRAGHGSDRMSALSVEYCRRARQHLAVVGAGFAFLDEIADRASIQGQKDVLQRKHTRRAATAANRRSNHVSLSKRKHAFAMANKARVTAAWAKRSIYHKRRLVQLGRQVPARTIHLTVGAPGNWIAYW
ncbi:lytic transglycosylase domain-containing protein [Microvirga yunnanensis]|uniref:lytic transglycosylase domain-containing protein n=1 Tax=Microvirga yunnanensis TaxID=2953740 RepID=UPI0021C82DF3|nr:MULTISPECIES: transglycosylase SLT domain-containing protein [unclassified Microvirga]